MSKRHAVACGGSGCRLVSTTAYVIKNATKTCATAKRRTRRSPRLQYTVRVSTYTTKVFQKFLVVTTTMQPKASQGKDTGDSVNFYSASLTYLQVVIQML